MKYFQFSAVILAVTVRKIWRNDENVARLRRKTVVFDIMRACPFDYNVYLIKIMRMHQKRKIVFMNVNGG